MTYSKLISGFADRPLGEEQDNHNDNNNHNNNNDEPGIRFNLQIYEGYFISMIIKRL